MRAGIDPQLEALRRVGSGQPPGWHRGDPHRYRRPQAPIKGSRTVAFAASAQTRRSFADDAERVGTSVLTAERPTPRPLQQGGSRPNPVPWTASVSEERCGGAPAKSNRERYSEISRSRSALSDFRTAALPLKDTMPFSSTYTRSARANENSTPCSASKMVRPCTFSSPILSSSV